MTGTEQGLEARIKQLEEELRDALKRIAKLEAILQKEESEQQEAPEYEVPGYQPGTLAKVFRAGDGTEYLYGVHAALYIGASRTLLNANKKKWGLVQKTFKGKSVYYLRSQLDEVKKILHG